MIRQDLTPLQIREITLDLWFVVLPVVLFSRVQVGEGIGALSLAGPRGAFVSGLIGMGVVAAIRFTQNTLLPKLGVSQRKSHVLFI